MQKKIWYIVGVMSGTSLDGVDLAYIKFENNQKLSFEIIHKTAISYSDNWKTKLTHAFTEPKENIDELNITYGVYLGELIRDFIEINQIDKIDLVASHGHTIFHKPEEGFTLQIGDGASIAKTCNQKVICDFRSQDVALGGQGAPLVPIGDQLLFSEYDYCVNIGGFANVSFDESGIRKAYDICPANIVLNHYTRKLNLEYDKGGKMARSGKLNQLLLDELDALLIYKEKNSLGNEIVISDFIPLLDSYNLKIEDILHTFIEHFSKKIGNELKGEGSALITGGGAYNTFLVERIKHYSDSKIIIPSDELIEYKEALIFALLGLLKSEGEVNCLASVTRAQKNHSSGVIFIP